MPRQILKCDMVQEFPSREYSSLEQEHLILLIMYPMEFIEFLIGARLEHINFIEFLLKEQQIVPESQEKQIVAIRKNRNDYELICYGTAYYNTEEGDAINFGFWSNVLQLGKIVVCADDITQKLYFSKDSFFKEFNETERLKAE